MIIVLNNDQFGKNLRYLRLKQGITQKDLAKQCGVSVYRIRFIERGQIRDIEDFLLKDLCSTVGGNMDAMLSTSMWETVEENAE